MVKSLILKKYIGFLRFFAVCSCLCLFFISDLLAYSYKIRPVSHNLWLPLSKYDKKIIDQVAAYLDAKKYNEAMRLVDKFQRSNVKSSYDESNPFFLNKGNLSNSLRNIILWSKYSNVENDQELKNISFSDISRFVADNDFYPNVKELRNNVEKLAVITGAPYRLSEQYFKANPAKDIESKMFLIESKEDFLKTSDSEDVEKEKIVDEIKSDISLTWINDDFVGDQEMKFLDKYKGVLTIDDHVGRIERLIWDKKYSDAGKILRLVDKSRSDYYKMVMKILRNSKKLRSNLKKIPKIYRETELTRYAVIKWYTKNQKYQKAAKLLKKVSFMQEPRRWWGLRLLYARELLKSDDADDSYVVVSAHGLTEDNKKYWEAQWTSGWLALRFLDEPEIAYSHFKKLYDHVKQPVTIARASYWLGMAAQSSGNKDLALKWYKKASEYSLYFYGQLAIHKIRTLEPLESDGKIILPKDPEIEMADAYNVSESQKLQIAYLLGMMKDRESSVAIFKGFIRGSDSPGEIALAMRLVSEFKDFEMDSKVSRAAEKKNVFFIRRKFKILKEVEDKSNSALIHAIIKQESGFVPAALSRVGAVGYMQLMPGTAKNVAKDLGLSYNRRKLTRNTAYNIKLGSHYIKQMVDRFDGSKMLAIAAYNAGPHNSDRWIREFYDPRKVKDIDKVIDWIELITYSETRNYVQRIMENLIVYKYIMSGNLEENEPV